MEKLKSLYTDLNETEKKAFLEFIKKDLQTKRLIEGGFFSGPAPLNKGLFSGPSPTAGSRCPTCGR